MRNEVALQYATHKQMLKHADLVWYILRYMLATLLTSIIHLYDTNIMLSDSTFFRAFYHVLHSSNIPSSPVHHDSTSLENVIINLKSLVNITTPSL